MAYLFLFLATTVIAAASGIFILLNQKFNPKLFGWSVSGLGLVSGLANFLYFLGLSMKLICLLGAAVSFIGLFLILYHGHGKNWVKETIAIFILSAVVSTPAIYRGIQFSFFQGNHWDMITYLSSSVAYQNFTASEAQKINTENFLEYPFLDLGKDNLNFRPAAHLLFGALSLPFKEKAQELAYLFLVFCGIVLSWVVARGAKIFIAGLPRNFEKIIFLGFSGTIGFQILLDMNAWSQILAAPIWLVSYFSFLQIIQKPDNNIDSKLVFVFSMGALASTYSEGNLLLWGLLAAHLIWIQRYRLIRLEPIGKALAGAFLVSVFYSLTSLIEVWKFLVRQTGSFSSIRPNWYLYFFRIYYDDENIIWSILSAPARFLGFYFPARFNGDSSASDIIFGLPLNGAFALLGLFFFGKWLFIKRSRIDFKLSNLGAAKIYFWLATLFLVVTHRYWILGKIFMMAFPLFYLAALRFTFANFSKKAFLALISFQMVLTGWRGYAIATSESGIHYSHPWPAIQVKELKQKVDYESLFELSRFNSCSKINFESNNGFIKTFAALSAYLNSKPFYFPGSLKGYFGQGELVGTNPPILTTPECSLKIDL